LGLRLLAEQAQLLELAQVLHLDCHPHVRRSAGLDLNLDIHHGRERR
jgi:hypothetical protein